jgi:hypothetical protein
MALPISGTRSLSLSLHWHHPPITQADHGLQGINHVTLHVTGLSEFQKPQKLASFFYHITAHGPHYLSVHDHDHDIEDKSWICMCSWIQGIGCMSTSPKSKEYKIHIDASTVNSCSIPVCTQPTSPCFSHGHLDIPPNRLISHADLVPRRLV